MSTTQSFVPSTSRSVATLSAGPIDAADSFVAVDLPIGEIGPHDLLVAVKAVSVNSVDVKHRAGNQEQGSRRFSGTTRPAPWWPSAPT